MHNLYFLNIYAKVSKKFREKKKFAIDLKSAHGCIL